MPDTTSLRAAVDGIADRVWGYVFDGSLPAGAGQALIDELKAMAVRLDLLESPDTEDYDDD